MEVEKFNPILSLPNFFNFYKSETAHISKNIIKFPTKITSTNDTQLITLGSYRMQPHKLYFLKKSTRLQETNFYSQGLANRSNGPDIANYRSPKLSQNC